MTRSIFLLLAAAFSFSLPLQQAKSGGVDNGRAELKVLATVSTAGTVDAGPVILRNRRLSLLPLSFVRERRDASATIRYTVAADGRLLGAEVRETTDPAFSGHMIAVLRRSRFEPASLAGVPVESSVTFRMTLAFGPEEAPKTVALHRPAAQE